MTNGEKIKETFPNLRVILRDSCVQVMDEDCSFCNAYTLEWWNAEYEEPTTKNDLGVDCISRADAIRVASGYCHPSNVAKELAKLPSVTLQPRWIPISEKLPKEFETVILSTDKDEVFVGDYLGKMNDGSDCFDDNEGMDWEGNVVAWMPLPEPYDAESEDKE